MERSDEMSRYIHNMFFADKIDYIAEEYLKPEETRKFIENAFRDGEIKTEGTDIEKILPPVSRFGSGRDQKKQGVIEKLRAFFEKYFGVGGSASFVEEHKTVMYEMPENRNLMVAAEPESDYGKKEI